jgi:hypothetical protein
MVSAQAYGIQFENEIHAFLNQTKYDFLLNEKEIRQYDSTITAIDHLLIINNMCFCIHIRFANNKWLSTTISNSNFNHFCKCVEKVATKINTMKIYGIYISNNDFSSIANKQLEDENNKTAQSNIEYIKINHTNKTMLFDKLHKFLYAKHIFIYDKDNDCVMI